MVLSLGASCRSVTHSGLVCRAGLSESVQALWAVALRHQERRQVWCDVRILLICFIIGAYGSRVCKHCELDCESPLRRVRMSVMRSAELGRPTKCTSQALPSRSVSPASPAWPCQCPCDVGSVPSVCQQRCYFVRVSQFRQHPICGGLLPECRADGKQIRYSFSAQTRDTIEDSVSIAVAQ